MHRRRNTILGLKNESGSWTFSQDGIHDLIVNFFQNLFSSHKVAAIPTSISHIPHPLVSSQNCLSHTQPPTYLEIYQAVMSFQPLKVSGLDGIDPIFSKKFWSFTNHHLHQIISGFFASSKLPDDINLTNLVLIPKTNHPDFVRNYRLISPYNTSYKIITKVLVHRLRPFLCSLISPHQSSFLLDRRASDSIVIAQGILEYMFKPTTRKNYYIANKLDITKAFDCLKWDFIKKVLDFFDFSGQFMNLILTCLSSVLRVLVNGRPSNPIIPCSGVRQGHPLSPYLFILAMEYLSLSISHLVNQGLWKPICINLKAPGISHLLFVDDIILFARAYTPNANLILNTLSDIGDLFGF